MLAGVMVILEAYCLRDLPKGREPNHLLATLLAQAATIALHLWRQSALSILGGGYHLHVALVSTFLAH